MRRFVLFGLLVACCIGFQAFGKDSAPTEGKKMSPLLEHKMKSLDGEEVDLAELQGKVLLVVNVASKCGATPQYKDLQALQEKFEKEGLVVLGFPCNQFGGQEPGDREEIHATCTDKYHVTFPMFEKIEVNGDNACPLYKQLTSEEFSKEDPGPVKWNFEKFLIDREGKVAARFRTKISPESKEVVSAIEQALAEKVEGAEAN